VVSGGNQYAGGTSFTINNLQADTSYIITIESGTGAYTYEPYGISLNFTTLVINNLTK